MNCQTHGEQIRFVCRADSCHFLPLCSSCQQQHSLKHKTSDIVSISNALHLASHNLSRQKETIDDLFQPFINRRKLIKKIEEQKKELKIERDRLVKQIDKFIDEEINRLNRQNNVVNFKNTETQLEKDLQEKSKIIDELLDGYRWKAPILQRALNFDLEKFIESLGRDERRLYETSNFKFYQNLKHQIMLSKLKLVTQSTITKPFRKIMNESPLYFLIDPANNSSQLLFNFNSQKQAIQIYNVQDQEWMTYHPNKKEYVINKQAAAVHDPTSNRFYSIGGTIGQNKSKSILVFSLNEPEKQKKWDQLQLINARSSCMATLIKVNDSKGNPKRGILVVGGMGEIEGKKEVEVLKSCEFIDLDSGKSRVISFGQTNFATFSGTLVVFNNSTVLRLGGLSIKSKDYSVVVEVVQKLDCQQAFINYQKHQKEPRWSYVELELPKGEYLTNPKLFYANQAAIQLNPNEVFVFGGLDRGLNGGLQGVTESYLIGLEEFNAPSRQVKNNQKVSKQQRFSVRWVNEKPLISGDDFAGIKPLIWKQRLYTFQNTGARQDQKRMLQFDMYQWYQTENVLPK